MVMIFYLISSVYFYLFTINLLLFFLLFISCLNLSLDFFFLITIYLLCIISSFILNLLFGFILFGFLNYFSPLAHYSFHCAFFFFLTWYLFNFLLYSLAFFIYYLYIHFVYFVGSLAHFKFTYLFSGIVPSFLANFVAISSISIWQFNSLFHLFLRQCFQCLGRLESVFG